MPPRPIYLDHQATTPVDPRVLEAMLPFFRDRFGNAASRTHRYGWEADEAVEAARAEIARAAGASSPKEIVFTSGATEADNLAVTGVLEAYGDKGRHLVAGATEHSAVRDPLRRLAETGRAEVTWVPVDEGGRVSADAVRDALREDTILVSVMHANNEIGTVSDIAAIGAVCREAGVFFHTDAAQSLGKIDFDVDAMNVDLASFSAHKLYGPQGIGALYLRRRGPRVRPEPLIHGGGHERGFRSGTVPVALVVGFGEAVRLSMACFGEERERLVRLRSRLLERVENDVPGVHLNGSRTHRLPGNLNLAFEGLDADALILALRELAISAGSACTSATPEPSHVLRALGISDELADGSIRIGLGRFTTEAEVDRAGDLLVERVAELRVRTGARAS